MAGDFIVRIHVHDQDAVQAIIRNIRKRFGEDTACQLRNHHLLVELGLTGSIDKALIDLEACLKQLELDPARERLRTAEIVETGFTDQLEKVDLPVDIRLDPAFSFGSGNHPSTRLAMGLLERYRQGRSLGRVLDVGCGSGILALLAGRYAAVRVLGVEIDPESVETARENVLANSLEETVTISDQPLSEIKGEFDLILANITVSVFYKLEPDIDRLASQGAHLIVSGLQGRQARELALFMERHNWVELEQEAMGRWRSLLLEKSKRRRV